MIKISFKNIMIFEIDTNSGTCISDERKQTV